MISKITILDSCLHINNRTKYKHPFVNVLKHNYWILSLCGIICALMYTLQYVHYAALLNQLTWLLLSYFSIAIYQYSWYVLCKLADILLYTWSQIEIGIDEKNLRKLVDLGSSILYIITNYTKYFHFLKTFSKSWMAYFTFFHADFDSCYA